MTHQQIQAALRRPPVFGDTEQIAALRVLREEEAAKEGKNEYRVTVEYSGAETVTVWAKDEAEAKDLAREQVDFDDMDISCHVRQVSGPKAAAV